MNLIGHARILVCDNSYIKKHPDPSFLCEGSGNETFPIAINAGCFKGNPQFIIKDPHSYKYIEWCNFCTGLCFPGIGSCCSSWYITHQWEEAIQTVRDNRDVRVVILKSDVPGTFCAGADLKERAKMPESDVGRFLARARRVSREFGELPMPVIAAMDGVAVGGGMEIALTADIRVAGVYDCRALLVLF